MLLWSGEGVVYNRVTMMSNFWTKQIGQKSRYGSKTIGVLVPVRANAYGAVKEESIESYFYEVSPFS
jgi:hypothetical protein